MNNFRRGISILGFVAIVLVNVCGLIPPRYKGFNHRVSENVASVYTPMEMDSSSIPIRQWLTREQTGQHVDVYIRNNYRDELIAIYPRATLAVCSVMLALWAFPGFKPPKKGSTASQ